MEEEAQQTPNQNNSSPRQPTQSPQPIIQEPTKTSHKWLIVIISIITLIIIIGAIFVIFSGDRKESSSNEVLETIESELNIVGYASQEIIEVKENIVKDSLEEVFYCGISTLEVSGDMGRISFADDEVLICMGRKIVAGCEKSFMLRGDGESEGKILYEIIGGENHLCDIRITTIGGWLLDGQKVWGLEREDFDGVPINDSMTDEELAKLPLRPF
ncbi:hypothetical protein HN935_03620 [archaeon]|jgi:hypothetical protein|nr:hypothetical protein [archaeon]